MSLGTDQGLLMSPELQGVVERAQHDSESGGRRPGVLTSDPDQGVVLSGRLFAPAAGDGVSVTLELKRSTTRLSDACVLTRKWPETGLGRCETASTEEPSGGNLLARI